MAQGYLGLAGFGAARMLSFEGVARQLAKKYLMQPERFKLNKRILSKISVVHFC
jgi:hypothetical protein